MQAVISLPAAAGLRLTALWIYTTEFRMSTDVSQLSWLISIIYTDSTQFTLSSY